ncbi:MBL fold metallo-hydrolase [Nonomuraea sp. B19D2]|uniref:MBL fold metallo-hydrolase n=1 Tax=Nonomuraea sp. B19D2 TaxID=3159561 RepID=UPI0032DAF0C0
MRGHDQARPGQGGGPRLTRSEHGSDRTGRRHRHPCQGVLRLGRDGPADFFPGSPDDAWDEHQSWLAPDFLDSGTGECVSAIQTWLLRSEGRTIIVDTGVGNHKDRPYAPVWSRLDTNFLDNLAAAGVRPDDVDVVINTHLHIDHVGWNTYLDGRTWVPTFPNATYLMTRQDFDFWSPANNHEPLLGRGNQNVFEDSVAPVHEAGADPPVGRLVPDRPEPPAGSRARPHPGSSVLTLESRGDCALFVGDLAQPAAAPRAGDELLLLRGPGRGPGDPPQAPRPRGRGQHAGLPSSPRRPGRCRGRA